MIPEIFHPSVFFAASMSIQRDVASIAVLAGIDAPVHESAEYGTSSVKSQRSARILIWCPLWKPNLYRVVARGVSIGGVMLIAKDVGCGILIQ